MKVKPLAAVFKKKSMKLYLFLKVTQKLNSIVVCCLHKRKDIKKRFKKKIEAVIEKCLLNSCLFKLSKLLEKYL